MPAYSYHAVTPAGAARRGIEEASSSEALTRALSTRGLYPIAVLPSSAAGGRSARRLFGGSRRADVVEAVRYLATLIGAGFPLDRALSVTARVASRVDTANVVRQVQTRVRAGAHLADAMAEHPAVFPRLAVGMARAGERGGHLGEALTRLAEQLEREQSLRARLFSAMVYPAVMFASGSVAIALLLLYVLPRLVELLEESGASVPRSTALLMSAANVIGNWWPMILAGTVAAVFVASAFYRTTGGRRAAHRVLLRMPITGPIRQRLAAGRLGRSLATLLGGGVSVLKALEISAEALADAAATEEVSRAREEVRAGTRLAGALGRGRVFPYVFLQMVEVGEDSGQLPEMLTRGAAAMEQEVERGLERLVRLAEPALILLFGGAVGFVAIALLGAIYGVHAEAF